MSETNRQLCSLNESDMRAEIDARIIELVAGALREYIPEVEEVALLDFGNLRGLATLIEKRAEQAPPEIPPGREHAETSGTTPTALEPTLGQHPDPAAPTLDELRAAYRAAPRNDLVACHDALLALMRALEKALAERTSQLADRLAEVLIAEADSRDEAARADEAEARVRELEAQLHVAEENLGLMADRLARLLNAPKRLAEPRCMASESCDEEPLYCREHRRVGDDDVLDDAELDRLVRAGETCLPLFAPYGPADARESCRRILRAAGRYVAPRVGREKVRAAIADATDKEMVAHGSYTWGAIVDRVTNAVMAALEAKP